MAEINKVQMLIRNFLYETKDVVESAEKSQEWLKRFRDTLNYQWLEKNPLPFGIELLEEAQLFNYKQAIKQMMRWAKSELTSNGAKNPSREDVVKKAVERYGEEFKSMYDKVKVNEVDETSSAQAKTSSRKSNQQTMQKQPEHLVYGTNENVFLTSEQHAELARRIGNVNELSSLLDNFSNALEDGSKKSANHFATLCNWISYRKERQSSGTPSNQIRFEDWNEKSARIYNEAIARLEAKYGGG